MLRLSLSAVVAVLALLPFLGTAHAFDRTGHEAAALIAEAHLEKRARAQISLLLGSGVSMADVSYWADTIRRHRPATAKWHYVNIDVRKPAERESWRQECPDDDCVVGRVERDIETLRDTGVPVARRREALKFLIHFVADLHQPLHCANDDDRGGNDKQVRFFAAGSRKGRKTNLHELWDRLLRPEAKAQSEELARRLLSGLEPAQRQSWQQGSPQDWAWESHLIARNVIYVGMPRGRTTAEAVKLAAGYRNHTLRALAEQQVLKAGLRLALIINRLFADVAPLPQAAGPADEPAPK
jgi:hypothetical protein